MFDLTNVFGFSLIIFIQQNDNGTIFKPSKAQPLTGGLAQWRAEVHSGKFLLNFPSEHQAANRWPQSYAVKCLRFSFGQTLGIFLLCIHRVAIIIEPYARTKILFTFTDIFIFLLDNETTRILYRNNILEKIQ